MRWRPRQHVHRWAAALAVLLGASSLANPPAIGREVDFYRDLYPVLRSNCIACHNKTTNKAALNLETPESIRKGGDSGEGVTPGKSAESLVYQAAAHLEGLEMPPRGNKSGARRLTTQELALLKDWIDQGARGSVPQARQLAWQPLPPSVQPIYSVALTRDGRRAACGRANQVFVYDLATRQLAARLVDETLDPPGSSRRHGVAHRALVQSLAFSPDGMRLASGSFREVKIWRRVDEPVATRPGDPALGAVVSVLSADGAQVACADAQGILHVLDAASGKTIQSIATGKPAAATLLAFSPDRSKLAAVAADGVLGAWSLATGTRLARKEDPGGVRALAWTGDGRGLATGGDDNRVRLWSPAAEEAKGELVLAKELEGAAGPVTAIATAGDRLVAASGDGKVCLWNLAEAGPGRALATTGVVALALSHDGTRLAAGQGDGGVQVWDLAAGKPIQSLSGDAETNARLAALERAAAAEELEIRFRKQELARVEAQSKVLEARLKKTGETIAAVRKALAEAQGTLRQAVEAKVKAQNAVAAAADRLKAADGKPDAALEKAVKDAQDQLNAATVKETAAQAAVKAEETHRADAELDVRNDTAAQARNTQARASATEALNRAQAAQKQAATDAEAAKRAAAGPKPAPLAVRFADDGQTVAAVAADGSVRVWAVASGLPIASVAGTGKGKGKEQGKGSTAPASLAACAGGGFAASTADGSIIRVPTTSRWVLERTLGGATASSPFVDRVNALRFSPDGQRLAAGGGEPTRSGDVSLWDVAGGRLIREWKERHADAVLSLDFSPDGKQLASGGADRLARVADVASGKLVHVLEGHTHHVLGVSFRADGRTLATAGGDGAVIVWDVLSGERKTKIAGWSKEVTALQYIGASSQIVTSAGDNQVRIVDDRGSAVRAMAGLPDFMQSAASADTARVVVAGGEDGWLRVWNGTTGQELAAFGTDASSSPDRP
jgi:WD40 repeat protein